jgi:hypothetical protein
VTGRATASARGALVLGLAGLLLAAAPARAAEPIEGAWLFEGGQVLVEPGAGPGTFMGTVVRPTRFIDCAHPRGERMWTLSGAGEAYTGTHRWFTSADCSAQAPGEATWRVRESGDRYLLVLCTAPPGAGSPTSSNPRTQCSTLERAKPADPDPDAPGDTASERGEEPRSSPPVACSGPACLVAPGPRGAGGCVPRGRFSHRFALRLRRGARGLRVRLVRFTLDWKPNGVDRRSPWVARVDGRRLAPGPHLLLADVRLARRTTRRTVVRRVSYRFTSCG